MRIFSTSSAEAARRRASSAPADVHELGKFSNYKNEHHTCGFCGKAAYHYCKTCFPDSKPTFAIYNPNTRAGCYAKHVAGHMPIHKINIGIKKKGATRTSPRQAERAQARHGTGSADFGDTTRRL